MQGIDLRAGEVQVVRKGRVAARVRGAEVGVSVVAETEHGDAVDARLREALGEGVRVEVACTSGMCGPVWKSRWMVRDGKFRVREGTSYLLMRPRSIASQRRAEAGRDHRAVSHARRRSASAAIIPCTLVRPDRRARRRSCRPPAASAADDAAVGQTVGPALPLRSNSSSWWSPRYQERSFQPITVGSSAGSSATQPSGCATGSRSSASTYPVPASRSTSTAPAAASAWRVWRCGHPVHHARSVRVPGPNAASQRRTSSVRAASGSRAGRPPSSQSAVAAHRYWLEIHVPRGCPRTMRASVASRTAAAWTGPRFRPRAALAETEPCRELGDVGGELPGGGLTAFLERRERPFRHFRQPPIGCGSMP